MAIVYKNVLVLNNSGSTNADRSRKLIAELKSHFGKKNVVEVDISGTTPDKIKAVVESHRSQLSPHTIIAVGGGDGTTSNVAYAMTTSTKLNASQRHAVLFPLWGGNANDLAVMLNGYINKLSLDKMLAEGSAVKIYPLRLILRPPGEDPQTRIAVCYVSFGATAKALWNLEDSAHARGSGGPHNLLTRFIGELVVGTKAIFTADAIRVQSKNHKVETMYDRLFVNGPKFAKILSSPVELNQRKYFESITKRSNWYFLIDTLRHFFKRGNGRASNATRRFIIKDATMAQIDGEIIGLEADTSVEIAIHDTPFIALSRKMKQTDKKSEK